MPLQIKYNVLENEIIDITEINKIFATTSIDSLNIEYFYHSSIDINGLKNVKHLIIEGDFTGNIINCPDLETININSTNFNSDIECNSKLNQIYIKSVSYNKIPINIDKSNLKSLTIISSIFNQYLGNLPNTLEFLYINCDNYDFEFDNLPYSLIIFKFIVSEYKYEFNKLPFGIKKIKLKIDNYCKTFGNIPNSIVELYLIDYYGDYNTIPDTIELLDIKFSFDNSRLKEIRQTFNNFTKLPSKLKFLNYQKDIYKIKMKAFSRNPELDVLKIIVTQNDCSNIIINNGEYTY